jgi:hypothetical protein
VKFKTLVTPLFGSGSALSPGHTLAAPDGLIRTWPRATCFREISSKASRLPGNKFDFSQSIQMRFNDLIAGVKEDLAIKVSALTSALDVQKQTKKQCRSSSRLFLETQLSLHCVFSESWDSVRGVRNDRLHLARVRSTVGAWHLGWHELQKKAQKQSS